jgi:hypothetical protein
MNLNSEDAQIAVAMWDTMYPPVVFKQPTGETCDNPDCTCGGTGQVVVVIPIDISAN